MLRIRTNKNTPKPVSQDPATTIKVLINKEVSIDGKVAHSGLVGIVKNNAPSNSLKVVIQKEIPLDSNYSTTEMVSNNHTIAVLPNVNIGDAIGGAIHKEMEVILENVKELEGNASDSANQAQIDADRIAAVEAKVEADRVEVAANKDIVIADKNTVQALRDEVAIDKGLVAADKVAVEALKESVASLENQAGQHSQDASNHAFNASQKASEAAASALEAKNAAATVVGSMDDAGAFDASLGVYPEKPNRSTFWKVTVSGDVEGVDYGVGDTLVYTQKLNEFYKIDNTESVTSVNGKKGIVTLEAADVKALPITGGYMQGSLVLSDNSRLDGHNHVNRHSTTKSSYTHYYDDLTSGMTEHNLRFAKGDGNLTAYNFNGSGAIHSDTEGRFYSQGFKPTAVDVGLGNITNLSSGIYGSIDVRGIKSKYSGINFPDVGYWIGVDALGNFGVGDNSNNGSYMWHFAKDTLKQGKIPWARIPDVPETASRWPTTTEIGLGKQVAFGGNANAITTAQFLALCRANGAFVNQHWSARGTWSYNSNQTITDTGCGNIGLAGATVEIIGISEEACTVRIHTAPTSNAGGLTSAEFVYVNNGSSYLPAWRRVYNTVHRPTPTDIGALPATGGTLTGRLDITVPNNTPSLFLHNGGGWSYMELKSGANQSHIALNDKAIDGGIAGSLHLRPAGTQYGSLILQPNSLMIHQSPTGWVGIGSANASYVHFQTDRPKYHFDKEVQVQGEIMAGANYNQRVYHQGFKPTPDEIGALPIGGGQMTGNIHANGGGGFYPAANNNGAVGNSGWRFNEGWFNSINGTTVRAERMVRGFGTSNVFGGAGLETGATTTEPSISFHKEGAYAATLRLIANGSFAFVNQDNSAYADLTIRSMSIQGSINSNLNVNANISVNQTDGTGLGVSLYGNATTDPEYGLMFAKTATFGTHGGVVGDWATYFNMTGASNRGWIFRNKGVGMAASLSSTGHLTLNNIRTGDITSTSWLRTEGDGGWYSATHGGGFHMTNPTWVEVYGGKKFYVANTEFDSIQVGGGIYLGGGSINNIGHGVTGVYAADKFQGVFAMGHQYRLPANGVGSGTLYGIAWTHSNNPSAEARKVSGHQMVLMDNGKTYVAAGTGGIWANGTINSGSNMNAGGIVNAVAAGGSWGHGNSSGFTISNASSAGTAYNLVGVPAGARIQALGGTGGTVRIYPNNGSTHFLDISNSGIQTAAISASGRITTSSGFSGSGSGLFDIPYSAIAKQWVTFAKYTPTACTGLVGLPSAVLSHLAAGGTVGFRLFQNQSNTIGGFRLAREFFVDGTDGWQGSHQAVEQNWDWPNVSYTRLYSAHTNFAAERRNCIWSQYSNIARVDYQLL